MRPERAAGTKSHQMTRYLISFDAHAMDHIPDEEMSAVAKAAHEVVQEALNAGVWVFGGGLENQKASVVATDGTVADGPYPEAIGGFCVVDVRSREEALGLPRTPSPAAVLKRSASSCPTQPSATRGPSPAPAFRNAPRAMGSEGQAG
jgi:hypothetical protein